MTRQNTALLHILCCLFWLLLPATHAVSGTAAAPQRTLVFEQQRPFQGLIRRETALAAAKVAAELSAIHQAMRSLAREPSLQLATNTCKENAQPLPSLPGLARLLYTTRLSVEGISGFPPSAKAVAQVVLVPPTAPLRESVIAGLKNQTSLALCSIVFEEQTRLLANYDALAKPLLTVSAETTGKEAELQKIQIIFDKLKALEVYLTLLPQRTSTWNAPQAVEEILLRIHTLDPTSPLILTALAEVNLQLDRPAEALNYANAAISSAPHLYFAYDIKGAALLRQRLPASAAAAFTEALTLSPQNAELYAHRAAAFFVQEEIAAMCSDFRTACALADCTGYQWAKDTAKCFEPTSPQQ